MCFSQQHFFLLKQWGYLSLDLNSLSVNPHEVEHAGPATPLLWSSTGTQDFHPPSPFLVVSVMHTLLWEARKGTAQNGKGIERDDYMWEIKKKPTFLLTKGSCWLIALGNTQRLLCNTWLSIQGPLLTAAIEEEGERKNGSGFKASSQRNAHPTL